MRKKFPWKMLLWFLIPLIYTAIFVGIVLTPQMVPVYAWVVLVAALGLTWGVGLGAFGYQLKHWFQLKHWLGLPTPDFETVQGSIVYCEGFLPGVVQVKLEVAIDHFMDHMVVYENVALADLKKLFKGLNIFVEDGPIDLDGELVNGVTWPGIIKINWLGGCDKNAFYHECMHRVRQEIWKKAPDYRHEDAAAWNIVACIKHSPV
jgi:hypothetical protein